MDPHRGAVPVAAGAVKLLPSRLQGLRESVLLSQLPEHFYDSAAVTPVRLGIELLGESPGKIGFVQASVLRQRVCQLPRHGRVVRVEVASVIFRFGFEIHLELSQYLPLRQ